MNEVDQRVISTLETEIQKLTVHLAELSESHQSVAGSIRWNIKEKRKFIKDLKARKGGNR